MWHLIGTGDNMMRFYDRLHAMIDPSLLDKSGKVFYSGPDAFTKTSKVYLLGLNPGGTPNEAFSQKIRCEMVKAADPSREPWSYYIHLKKGNGTRGRMPLHGRVCHLLSRLKLDPTKIPTSNAIFVRSISESHLHKEEKLKLLAICWPIHQKVIEELDVKVILCMGGTVGKFVRKQMDTDKLSVDKWRETNNRRWRNQVHMNAAGIQVVTLTHPSRADWTQPNSDPSQLVQDAIDRCALAMRTI